MFELLALGAVLGALAGFAGGWAGARADAGDVSERWRSRMDALVSSYERELAAARESGAGDE
ncbi:hypothetical protein [Pseudonocardia sp. H11422]|uniref:hypothetical protein n=1 Tax=Pseudonocardia sp. H11422 TaxID=2835866 RepID=UPI001BDCAD2C|nr:hypothetical protein [Pseudonocardia sp. H11422]